MNTFLKNVNIIYFPEYWLSLEFDFALQEDIFLCKYVGGRNAYTSWHSQSEKMRPKKQHLWIINKGQWISI